MPLSPCPRLRCTLPATHLSLSLSPLPPPGALASWLVARWSLRTPLRPSSHLARLASPSLPCPVFPPPLAGHRVGNSHARTWPSLYVSTLRSALSGAPAYCGRLARQWGAFVHLPHAHPFMPPWHALVPAVPSLPLRPPASASTLRSNSLGSALSLPPLSVLAPWPCPAPCLLALPRPHMPPFPGPLVPGPQCLCPRLPFTLPACISRSNTRGTPPTPPSPCRSLVPWFCLHRSPRPSSPALPPPPSPALAPLLSFLLSPRWTLCRHVARMSQVRFRPLPSCPALSPSSPRRTLRRTLCRQVACTSQARTWPSSCDSTRGGPLRSNAPRRPALSRATAHCGRLARRSGTFVLPPHARSFVPSWHAPCPALPSLPLCPPASTSTMRSNSRGSAPSLPSLSALAPWPRPAPCLLALPRPLVPPFPGPLVPGPRCPYPRPSSLHPCCLHFAEQFARHPSHSPSTLPLPGALVPSAPARCLRPSSPAVPPPPSPALFLLYTPQYTSQVTLLACRMHVAGTRPAPPSPPCPVPSLHYAGHSAEHCVDTSHACRRHAPGFHWRRRREGWLHAVTARRCRSPRGSRRRGQPLHMPRGARPW